MWHGDDGKESQARQKDENEKRFHGGLEGGNNKAIFCFYLDFKCARQVLLPGFFVLRDYLPWPLQHFEQMPADWIKYHTL
jgi:hypothetical protein